MTELKGQSLDITAENIKAMEQLFPEAFQEGRVDFEVLRQLLGDFVEDAQERYSFRWNGKGQALRLSQTPSQGTLRPCRQESKEWDTTENLYIEGDNLEVLKLLQKSYYGQVKMIYIDPPYNTGGDFVYKDDYRDNIQNYKKLTGQVDEAGKKLDTNTDANGRFHTDWLNMMYPRLRLARNLLREDGVIFISIDDNEQANLKKICDEVFGESNFIAQVVWERAYSPINLMKHFSPSHDYILCYAKNIEKTLCNGIARSDEANDRYSNPDNDPRGVWKPSDLSVGPAVQENVYSITTPSGRVVEPPAGRSWSLSKNAFFERLQDNRIWFGSKGDNVPSMKRFLSELRKSGVTPMTIWKYTEVDHSQGATQKLAKIFDGKKFFDYPKSVSLIERCVQLYSNEDSCILDFFSGSATTAHAVMQLNAEDGGHRKFIMVQLPEPTDAKSEAHKAGYGNICEIGKERIRRAGAKIKSEAGDKAAGLDIGFRVFKLDSSNLQKWQPQHEDLLTSLQGMAENFLPDRSQEDVLYEIMLKLGLDLTCPVETANAAGETVYMAGGGALMVCLGQHIGTGVAEAMADLHRQQDSELWQVVFRDTGFESDMAKTNIKEILKSAGLQEECFVCV